MGKHDAERPLTRAELKLGFIRHVIAALVAAAQSISPPSGAAKAVIPR